jgi:dTDP-4-dehydrorhamnose reductase
MKVVVTGSKGQLGGELCRLLAAEAIPLDIDSLDLTDAAAVQNTLRQLRPELVINCAAYTQVDKAETEPAVCKAVNADAVDCLADCCAELDCPLVQISTDYVFGGCRGDRPFREDDPPAPQGVYAQTKLLGEHSAARHAKHIIIRTCGLYARPSDAAARNFVKTMLQLGRKGEPVRVVGDQHCTPSYVPHVAKAVLFLAGLYEFSKPAPWGIYHVTNGGQTTWFEFATEIFNLAGLDIEVEKITTADYHALAPRPLFSVLDNGAYNRLGGPELPDWKTALAEYIEQWRMSE